MRAVIFDLDGTLVDSTADICASFAHALESAGFLPPRDDHVRPLIGRPLAEMFAEFAPADAIEGLMAGYRAHYWDHCTDRTRPFPPAMGTLGALRRDGWRIGVATTKRTVLARHVLDRLGLLGAVDWAQGTDGLPPKPAPDTVERALTALGVAPGRDSWMVGDTVGDVLAGRAAGLSTAAVTSGTDDATRLASAEPDVLAADLDEVAAALR